jgi:hypothetical protein
MDRHKSRDKKPEDPAGQAGADRFIVKILGDR